MNSLRSCARRFAETHANDATRLLELSPAAEAAPFLSALPAEVAAQLLSFMSISSGAEHLSQMDAKPAAELTNQLSFDNAVSFLRRLSAERRAGVLAAMPQESRIHLEQLLEYPDGTVGAVTDPDVLSIPSDFSMDEAQRLLKKRVGVFHHQLYVVDSEHKLLGHLHVHDLLRAPGKNPVTSIMVTTLVCLPAETRLASTLHHRAWTQMDAIPIVDKAGVLLGIIRHRQLRLFQAIQQPGGVANTFVGLSELYWIGLANFLRGGVGEVKTSRDAPAKSAGGNHVA